MGLCLAFLSVGMAQSKTPQVAAYPDPPQVQFEDLFVAVQSAAIFADGKTFADAVPTAPAADILAQYHALTPDSPQALKRFVE